MTRKNIAVKMDPKTHIKLKVYAVQNGVTLGDALEQALEIGFAEMLRLKQIEEQASKVNQ